MGPRARFIVVAMLLVAGGITAFMVAGESKQPVLANGSPTPLTSTPDCLKPGGKIAVPVDAPTDLPLPDGTYLSDTPTVASKEIKLFVYVAKGTLDDQVRYILDAWPKQGWTQADKGEREAFEAEAVFVKARFLVQFRARTVFCRTDVTQVILITSDRTRLTSRAPFPSGSAIPTNSAVPTSAPSPTTSSSPVPTASGSP